MFDIGFSELLVCGVVALIVIGPERMPEAVRTMGLWIGRFKRSLRETRQEIERQIGVEDIRRQLHNEDIMRSLEKTRADINAELNSVIEHVQSDIDAEKRQHPQIQPQEHLPDHAHGQESGGNGQGNGQENELANTQQLGHDQEGHTTQPAHSVAASASTPTESPKLPL